MASSRDFGTEPLWRVADCARALSVHPRTIYLLSERGELPSVKIGRSLRFDPRAIRAFIERGGSVKAGAR